MSNESSRIANKNRKFGAICRSPIANTIRNSGAIATELLATELQRQNRSGMPSAVYRSQQQHSCPFQLDPKNNDTAVASAFAGLEDFSHDVASRKALRNAGGYSAYKAALKDVAARFKLREAVEPVDTHETGAVFDREAPAGWSYGTGRRCGEVMGEIYDDAKWLIHRMKQKHENTVHVRYPLGHAAKSVVGRLGWVWPAEMRACELMFALAMRSGFAAEGRVIPTAPKLAHAEAAAVPAFVLYDIFASLRSNINFATWQGRATSKGTQQKFENVWDNMVWYFVNATLVMPNGYVYRKTHGIVADSAWEPLVTSFVSAMCEHAGGRAPWLLDAPRAQRRLRPHRPRKSHEPGVTESQAINFKSKAERALHQDVTLAPRLTRHAAKRARQRKVRLEDVAAGKARCVRDGSTIVTVLPKVPAGSLTAADCERSCERSAEYKQNVAIRRASKKRAPKKGEATLADFVKQ